MELVSKFITDAQKKKPMVLVLPIKSHYASGRINVKRHFHLYTQSDLTTEILENGWPCSSRYRYMSWRPSSRYCLVSLFSQFVVVSLAVIASSNELRSDLVYEMN
jgi:hypothetical protein